MQALLARRADRLRAPAPVETTGDIAHIAELMVGDEHCAFHLERLRAVVPLKLVTPVPLSRPHIVGIFTYQHQILCVHSLAALLGVRGWRVDPSVVLVLEIDGERLVAVDAEQVPKASTLPMALVRRARDEGVGPLLHMDVPPHGRLIVVDDPEALIAEHARAR